MRGSLFRIMGFRLGSLGVLRVIDDVRDYGFWVYLHRLSAWWSAFRVTAWKLKAWKLWAVGFHWRERGFDKLW